MFVAHSSKEVVYLALVESLDDNRKNCRSFQLNWQLNIPLKQNLTVCSNMSLVQESSIFSFSDLQDISRTRCISSTVLQKKGHFLAM